MSREFDTACRQINDIDWKKVGKVENRESNFLLVKEYLRRISLLLKVYDFESTSPFINIAEILGVNDKIDLSAICLPLKECNTYCVDMFCEYYLKWAILIDREHEIALDFYDLYEPIIKLYSRGGYLYLRKGAIECGKSVMPPVGMYQNIPIDISDRALEQYEKVYKNGNLIL